MNHVARERAKKSFSIRSCETRKKTDKRLYINTKLNKMLSEFIFFLVASYNLIEKDFLTLSRNMFCQGNIQVLMESDFLLLDSTFSGDHCNKITFVNKSAVNEKPEFKWSFLKDWCVPCNFCRDFMHLQIESGLRQAYYMKRETYFIYYVSLFM